MCWHHEFTTPPTLRRGEELFPRDRKLQSVKSSQTPNTKWDAAVISMQWVTKLATLLVKDADYSKRVLKTCRQLRREGYLRQWLTICHVTKAAPLVFLVTCSINTPEVRANCWRQRFVILDDSWRKTVWLIVWTQQWPEWPMNQTRHRSLQSKMSICHFQMLMPLNSIAVSACHATISIF